MNALSKAAKATKEALLGKPAPAPETSPAEPIETAAPETPLTPQGEEPETRQEGSPASEDDTGATEGGEPLVRCRVLAVDGFDAGAGRWARQGEEVELTGPTATMHLLAGKLQLIED